MMRRRRIRKPASRPVRAGLAAGSVLVALALGGCSPDPGSITVSAAASLGEAFEEIAAEFESAHPGTEVVLNLAGSQTLAGQILEGAPVDVFASADDRQMKRVEEAGLVDGAPVPFASNGLAIAVASGNPLGIGSLADLTDPELVVVLAVEDAPIGAYSRAVIGEAGVSISPDSLEPDVRAVLSRVALGEADAGIVYRSDVARGGGVTGIPLESSVEVSYPVAALASTPEPELARAFVEFVTSAGETLSRHGFGPVEPPA
jgi:molybdate transport system substrate-binding protein